MSDTSPGWHPDPSGKHDHRYWDGAQWTENVANAGVASIDPFEAPSLEEPAETFVADEPFAADEPVEPAATDDPGVADEPHAADEPFAAGALFAASPIGGHETASPDLPYATDEPVADEPFADEPFAVEEPQGPGLFGSEDTVVDQAPVTTAAWPVTDAPDGAPAPPAPYVPTDPDGSDGSDGGLTSKRNLLIGGGVLVAVLLAFLAFTAFGGDDDGSPTAPIGNTDTTGPSDPTGTTEPPLDGEYGSDAALDELYDACEDGDFAACDQLYAAAASGSEYQTFGDTCGGRNEPSGFCVKLYQDETDGDDAGEPSDDALPEDFEETMAESYAAALGLDQEQAECLAGKFREAIEEGSLNEDEGMTGVVQYLADCDISLEDFSSN